MISRWSFKCVFSVVFLFYFVNFQSISQDYYTSGVQHRFMEENSPFSGIEWTSIGPVFQGGRVETIDCPVGQPGVIYAGLGSGSLWKTSDQGMSWDCIFKNEFTQSIGDLAISISDPNVLYLGTGENLRASRGFSLPGTGIYKSTDGGKTWYNKGLTDSHHIGRVVIDPSDHNIVFVAAIGHFWSKNDERGLFMSKDGGISWKKILFISDEVGVVDVAWDAINKIVYAAAWDMAGNKASGIYRSENLGYDWEKIENGLPHGDGIGRIALSISPSRPEVVYAILDNRNKEEPESSEVIGAQVYRSLDHGKSWARTHEDNIDNYSGFGWAFGDIRISPFDHNDIYILGVYLMHSGNGGKTFERVNGSIHHLKPNSGTSLHLDQHDLYIDPIHPDKLILGNDGGVYLSYNQGNNWTHCNTIPGAEFYDISIVDKDTVRIYGGTQDNSSIMGMLIPEEPTNLTDSWKYVWLDPWSGGDGFTTIESPADSNLVIYESQNGYLGAKDMLSGKTRHFKPSPDSDENPLRNSWFTPYFISVHDNETIYYGANKLYKTLDQGKSWIRLSPDLSYSRDQDKKSRSITAIAESPLEPGLLFAGTDKGIVWISRNDGVNWIEISKGIPVNKILEIVPSRHKDTRVYLVSKGMDNDDYSPYVHMSENLGKSWQLISTGIPYESVNCLIEDPVVPDLIYIGSDRSIYCSPDNGENWKSLGKNLPTAAVHKMKFIRNNKYILAATHGMSLFLAYTEPIRTFYVNNFPDEPFFMTGLDGRLPKQKDYRGDYDFNTRRNINISWYWPQNETVRISVINDKSQTVYSSYFDSGRGINQWSWDLIIEIKPDKTLYPVPEISFPEPGYYKILIEGTSGSAEGPVRISN